MATDQTPATVDIPAEDIELARKLHGALRSDVSRGAAILKGIDDPEEMILRAHGWGSEAQEQLPSFMQWRSKHNLGDRNDSLEKLLKTVKSIPEMSWVHSEFSSEYLKYGVEFKTLVDSDKSERDKTNDIKDISDRMKDTLERLQRVKRECDEYVPLLNEVRIKRDKLVMTNDGEPGDPPEVPIDRVIRSAIGTAGKQPPQFSSASVELRQARTQIDEAMIVAKRKKEKRDAYTEKLREAKRELALLEVMPSANPVNLRRLRLEAETKGGQGDYDEALNKLRDFKSLLSTEKNTANEFQRLKLDQLGKEPEYSTNLEEVKKRYEQIRVLPGCQSIAAQYADVIRRAEEKGSQDDFVAACKILQEVLKSRSDIPTVERAKSTSEEAVNGLASTDDTFRNAKAAAERALEELEDVATAEEYRAHQSQVAVLVSSAILSNGKKGSVEILLELAKNIKGRAERLSELKENTRRHMMGAHGTLEILRTLVGPTVTAPYSQRENTLKAMVEAREFDELFPQAKELDEELIVVSRLATDGLHAWENNASKLNRDVELCQNIIDNCPPGSREARRIKAHLKDLDAIATSNPKDPDLALKRYQSLHAELQTLKTNTFDAWSNEDLAGDRTTATNKLNEFTQNAQNALEDLASAISTARESDPSPDETPFLPHSQDVETLKSDWQTVINSALTSDDLRTNEFEEKGATLVESIKTATLPANVNESVATQKDAEAKRQFETDWKVLLGAIEQLSAYDSDQAAEIQKLALTVQSNAATDYTTAIREVVNLKGDANRKFETARSRQEAANQTVVAYRDQVQKEIEKLEKEVRSATTSFFSREFTFESFFEELKTEMGDLESMIASNNIQTLIAANEILRDIHDRVRQLSVDMKAEGAANFKQVAETVKAITKKLTDNELLTKYAANQLKLLTMQFDAQKKVLPNQSPADSLKNLRVLQASIITAEQTAEAAKSTREFFETEAKFVKSKIKQLDKRLKYRKAAQGKLDTLTALSQTEGKEVRALNDLGKLKVELNRALTDPAFLLEQDQAVNKKLLKAQKDKVQWEGRLQRFNKVDYIKAERAVSEVDGDKTLIDELDRMLKSMKSLAKGENYEEANTQLDMARQRVSYIIKHPHGPTIGARKALDKDVAVFKDAVRTYNDAMTAFPDSVEELSDDTTPLEGSVLTAIQGMMQTTSRDFLATEFDKTTAALSAKETKKNDRRAAREAALAAVRSYEALLQKSPAMQELAKNPIDRASVPGAMSGMYYALNRMKGNVMRACK